MHSMKKWGLLTLITTIGVLLFIAITVIIIDPFFHYHKPLSFLSYPLNNQRYQNDGILKHFDYDAIIIGSSMVECSSASQIDELFNVKTIKLPYQAATYKEINENLTKALEINPNINLVVRVIDYSRIFDNKDLMWYAPEDMPNYLYDNNPFNDVKYLFNKDVLKNDVKRVIEWSINKTPSTTFDEYSNWDDEKPYGVETIFLTYERPVKSDSVPILQEEYFTIEENIKSNVVKVCLDNPEVEFYYYFPPYSIYYWDERYQTGTLEKQFDAEKYAIELMLGIDNLHLFSFNTDFETITDPMNYRDSTHYSEKINAKIQNCFKTGEYELTLDNYEEYLEKEKEFYLNFDYDGLYR